MSSYIKAPHPKTEIRPRQDAIQRILAKGWVGQTKVHGHRVQFHISSAEKGIYAFNRQGQSHKFPLVPALENELRRLFTPTCGWNVVDGEWLKKENKVFLFDILKKEGQLLNGLSYSERYALLPKDFISPNLSVLPLLKTASQCQSILDCNEDWIEGLVFKSLDSVGFSDTSIIRCRSRQDYALD